MTIKEFETIPFKSVAHTSFDDEYCSTYYNETYDIGICHHTRRDVYGYATGKGFTHYKVHGRVYKSKRKLAEILRTIPFIKKQ